MRTKWKYITKKTDWVTQSSNPKSIQGHRNRNFIKQANR